MDTFFITVLAFNTAWFTIAFWSFSIRPVRTARLLVPWRDRHEASFAVLIHSLKFLGGINLALALFSLLLLVRADLRSTDIGRVIPAFVFCIAHGSQFFFNLPLALRQMRGERYLWPVLKGPMLAIFMIDAILCVANGLYVLAFYRIVG
jgi:hypothetical protein